MDLKETRLDSSKAQEGVWVPLDDKTRLLIARWNNPAYTKFVKRKMEPLKRRSRLGQMDDDLLEAITVEATAKHILLDWENLTDGGKKIAYSPETALKLLTDETLTWFKEAVLEYAMDFSLFRQQDLEDAEENIKK